jgi:hypothetical protein
MVFTVLFLNLYIAHLRRMFPSPQEGRSRELFRRGKRKGEEIFLQYLSTWLKREPKLYE